LQGLDVDRVVLAHERERRLVVEVAALLADILMLLGAALHRLRATTAPFLAAGHPLLRCLQRALGLPIVARVRHDLPVRREKEHRASHIDPVATPVRGSGAMGTSVHEKQTYQPSASRRMVTVLIVPASGRDQWTARRPIVDSTSAPLSRRAPLP
jgi:hypothetical protein